MQHRRGGHVHLLWMIIACAVILTVGAGVTPAHAASSSPFAKYGTYGEVTRFGGFDACWFDSGSYDGADSDGTCYRDKTESTAAAGEFVSPVGFAVDCQDPDQGGSATVASSCVSGTDATTAVYVLDRTSDLPANYSGTLPAYPGGPNAGSHYTTWRLQKFSAKGTLLATDEFSLPSDDAPLVTNSGTDSDYEMWGLAVDSHLQRIYALMVDNNLGGLGYEVGAEILAWSTKTTGGRIEGVPASGAAPALPSDTISAGLPAPSGPRYATPSVLSTQAQLVQPNGGRLSGAFSGYSAMESPTGIAIDNVSAGAGKTVGDVVVQGLDPTNPDSSGNTGAWGLVGVSPVPSGTQKAGALVSIWSSLDFSGDPNDQGDLSGYEAAGLSTDPADGSLTALTTYGNQTFSPEPGDIGVGSVPASLSSHPKVLADQAIEEVYPNSDPYPDDASVQTADTIPEQMDGGGTAATTTSSPQIVALSNGLYAGDWEPLVDANSATSPDVYNPLYSDAGGNASGPPPEFYLDATPGVRLIDPTAQASGLFSDPPSASGNYPLTTLYDTLGNPDPNSTGVTIGSDGTPSGSPGVSSTAASACNVSDETTFTNGTTASPSLAAGADGALWVLTNGSDTANYAGSLGAVAGGREVIELAPAKGDPCPGPSGTFTMSADGQTDTAGAAALPIKEGDTVTLDASGLQYPGSISDPAVASAARAEFAWTATTPDPGQPGGVLTLSSTVDPDPNTNFWSAATTQLKFDGPPGVYTVTMTLRGDYGTYVQTGLVNELPTQLAAASFTADPTAAQTGQPVAFDGSASNPSADATVSAYEWSFGDGQIDVTSTPTDSHVYASPGTYTVTLNVRDSKNDVSPAAAQTITVTAPPPAPPAAATTTPTPTPTTTPMTTPSTPSYPFALTRLASLKDGKILAGLTFPATGAVTVKATFTVKEKRKGSRAKRRRTVTFATLTAPASSGVTTLTLVPTAAGRGMLATLGRHAVLAVSVTVEYTPSTGARSARSGTLKVHGTKRVRHRPRHRKTSKTHTH